MDKEYDHLSIGTDITDCILRGFDPEPVSSYGYTAESCGLSAGGEGVNVSVAASGLGLRTAILCSLGRDGAGRIIEKALLENGVDCTRIVREEGTVTPVTVIFVGEDGNRKSITNLAHKYNFRPDRHGEAIGKASAVALGSLFRAPFNDPEVVLEVVRKAKASGATVYADTKQPNFVRLGLEDLKDSLPYVDYIFPNEAEAKLYTGKEDPEEMAEVLLSYGVKNAVVKLGENGCLFRNAEGSFRLPAYRVDTVDATGAGDNFLAGFISEKLRGADDLSALRFACACGAICATAVGASGAIRSREQVLDFMKRYE